ncbi:MAG: hypothetical protein V4580_04835 [Bacteroidota bacterium]
MIKFAAYILLLCVLISCKKKESPDPIPTPVNTTTNYTYGSLATVYYQIYTGNILTGSDSVVSAFFYTNTANPGATIVNAGTISFNGTPLINNTDYYSLYSSNIHHTNSVWVVSGSSNVPVINYTFTPNYPVFTGNAQLPDSFSLSNGFTIHVNGLSNFSNSTIHIEIADAANSVFKTMTVNQTSYTFSAAELSILQPTVSGCTILLTLSNATIENFGGKDYSFISTLESYKSSIKIKP